MLAGLSATGAFVLGVIVGWVAKRRRSDGGGFRVEYRTLTIRSEGTEDDAPSG